jgi:hypothetical protein
MADLQYVKETEREQTVWGGGTGNSNIKFTKKLFNNYETILRVFSSKENSFIYCS